MTFVVEPPEMVGCTECETMKTPLWILQLKEKLRGGLNLEMFLPFFYNRNILIARWYELQPASATTKCLLKLRMQTTKIIVRKTQPKRSQTSGNTNKTPPNTTPRLRVSSKRRHEEENNPQELSLPGLTTIVRSRVFPWRRSSLQAMSSTKKRLESRHCQVTSEGQS